MKERGILFTGEMVNAILQDRKLMSRRVCRVQPVLETGVDEPFWNVLYPWGEGGHGIYSTESEMRAEFDRLLLAHCPYGHPGDRLWVRETWLEYKGEIAFRASMPNPERFKWKPGIHLKRIHSRILLELTAVRVERAQEISEEDAKAEGVMRDGQHPRDGYWARKAFRLLWVKINGLESWEANPLVYVLSFKVLAKEPQTVRD